MAPNRKLTYPTQTTETVMVQPLSKTAHFKENPFKVEKTSRIMRCSSVSYSEEEKGLVLADRTEYVRSLASCSWSRSLFTINFDSASVVDALNSEQWAGVCSGLDEDESREKVKQRIVMEPEEKKEAVENDDKSFSWLQTSGTCLPDENKYSWKSATLELKTKEVEAGEWQVNLTKAFLTFYFYFENAYSSLFTQAAHLIFRQRGCDVVSLPWFHFSAYLQETAFCLPKSALALLLTFLTFLLFWRRSQTVKLRFFWRKQFYFRMPPTLYMYKNAWTYFIFETEIMLVKFTVLVQFLLIYVCATIYIQRFYVRR